LLLFIFPIAIRSRVELPFQLTSLRQRQQQQQATMRIVVVVVVVVVVLLTHWTDEWMDG